jgi:two-component system cell cycle sensor histidine kinase/response regulator CckA
MTIIHLEDSPQDAELIHFWLREEWPQCQIDLMDDRQTFIERLARPADLVLSDFTLASFTGLDALHLARDKEPDLPFIFLSGTITEERALEALRAGATDYLIKDRPKRLIPAIQRALREQKMVRERRAALDQMQRVERLEHLGMLAAGIAHDFNNVLASMLMGVRMLRSQNPGDGDLRILDSIESSAERGAALIRQILNFARGVSGETQIVQSRHLIRELADTIHQSYPQSIRLVEEIAPDLWPLKANPTQIYQVLLNLCVNARDAMPAGGTLTLRAANIAGEPAAAGTSEGSSAGGAPGVVFEVEDTGTGIPREIMERIWEPFFTTKEPGVGTGLGLATVRRIVEAHSGSVTVSSWPGKGTRFRLYFPAESPPLVLRATAEIATAPRGTGELVLVVDHDSSARDVVAAALAAHGYRVLAAAGSAEAIALLATRSLEVRAIILELDLPDINGPALGKVVEVLNPAIRLLLVSARSTWADLRLLPGAGFLAKPFGAEQLLATVYKLLHSSAVTAE